jgi:hypothetical protein
VDSWQDKDDASWGPNNKFRFPLRDGSGGIWRRLFEQINPNKFQFNCAVVEVDADNKALKLSDGARMAPT